MTEFSLFGVGEDGLPGEVDMLLDQFGAVERMASDIVDECEARARAALNSTRRPRPSIEIASRAYLLVAWHNKRGQRLPPVVMNALAHAMALVSYSGGGVVGEIARSAVSDDLKARIGLPVSVEMFHMDAFMSAARLDGVADSIGARLKREALAGPLGVSGRTIDAWRKERAYSVRRQIIRHWGSGGPFAPVPDALEGQIAWVRAALKLPE